MSLERQGNEDTFSPSSFFSVGERSNWKEKGYSDIQVLSAEFLIVLYEWKVSLLVAGGLELDDSQNPFQPKIFCDS